MASLSTDFTHQSVTSQFSPPISENIGEIDCQEITYFALHVITVSGLVIGAALFSAEMMTIGFVVCLVSLALAAINEIFLCPDEVGRSSPSGRRGGRSTVIREFQGMPIWFPPERDIPALPRVYPAQRNPLENQPVRQGRIYVNGEPKQMPDPGEQLEGTGVNPQHFIEVLEFERRIPPGAPSNIDIIHIKSFFNTINFTQPDAPCYVFSEAEAASGEGYEAYKNPEHIDLVSFANDLDRLIERLGHMEHPRPATLDHPADEPDPKTVNLFKLVIYKFLQIDDSLIRSDSPNYIPNDDSRLDEDSQDFDANVKQRRDAQIKKVDHRNQSLIRMIEGLSQCDNRVRMEVYETYRKAYGSDAEGLESDVKQQLEDLRMGIVSEMARLRAGQMVDSEMTGNLLYLLGPKRGITEEFFLQFSQLPTPDLELTGDICEEFNGHYNKEKLIDNIKNGMDGVPDERPGIRHRQFSIELFSTWFKNHVPPSYNAPLDTANYQTIGEQYLYEEVFVDAENLDFTIQRPAVEYFLKTIGVINDEQIADRYRSN